MFLSVLKVDLQVENLQLGDTQKLPTALALYMGNSLAPQPPHAPGAYLAGLACGLAVQGR